MGIGFNLKNNLCRFRQMQFLSFFLLFHFSLPLQVLLTGGGWVGGSPRQSQGWVCVSLPCICLCRTFEKFHVKYSSGFNAKVDKELGKFSPKLPNPLPTRVEKPKRNNSRGFSKVLHKQIKGKQNRQFLSGMALC